MRQIRGERQRERERELNGVSRKSFFSDTAVTIIGRRGKKDTERFRNDRRVFDSF